MKIQRTLPPSAAPLSWGDILRGLVAPLGRHALEKRTEEFQEHFGVQYVFWITSGKAALAVILSALTQLSSRRKVVIPAYTCFSVPSAVVKSGLKIGLCDVEPDTLDFNADDLEKKLDEDTLAVVPTHLFGLPVDVEHVKQYARKNGIYVIEDVAQAFGGMSDGKPLGTSGDVAFLSFGRGKNVTCGSGGVILTNDRNIGTAIQSVYDRLSTESAVDALGNWIQVVAMRLLLNPKLYWIPAGLPFLRLGETRFYTDFPMRRMDTIRAGLLAGWKARLQRDTQVRRERAQTFLHRLQKSIAAESAQPYCSKEAVYLRLPVCAFTRDEKNLLCTLSKQLGLGISPLYPGAIKDIPELEGELSRERTPGATRLAECLMTFPTHDLVTQQDIERICNAAQDILDRGDRKETVPTEETQRSMAPSRAKRIS
jgi:dTDP-4-amino-4,6-dideoxygalactose transaminase